jgi:hypothetical protein
MPYPIVEKINRTDVFEVWRQKLNVYQNMLEYIKAVLGAVPEELKTNNKKVIPAINELLTMVNTVNKRLGKLETLTFWRDDLTKSLQDYYNDTQAKIGDIRGAEALDVVEEDLKTINNLSRGVNRLNEIIGNKRSLKTKLKNNLTVSINEIYDYVGVNQLLKTDSKVVSSAVNEIFTILGTTSQLSISTNLPRTVIEAINDLDGRLVTTNTRSISNEQRLGVHDSELESHLNHINSLYSAHADLSRRAGDLAVLKTPVRTSLAGAIASLDEITIKNTDKWHVMNTTQSRTLDPTKGGIDPTGKKAPTGETGGWSITQKGSDIFNTGIRGFHGVYRLYEDKSYFGLGNINDVTHLPSELNFTMSRVKNVSNKPLEVIGYLKTIMSSQDLEVSSKGISAYDFITSAQSFTFNKKICSKEQVGICDSKTYFNKDNYYERGLALEVKYQTRADSLDPTKLNGDKMWYPYGVKGNSGYIFSYKDITDTINSSCHSGIIQTHSVGSCSPLLKTYSLHASNHVQTRRGYYVGVAGENGKLVVDGDGNAFFKNISVEGALEVKASGAPISGNGGDNTYSFVQEKDTYRFTTTSPSFTFNKPVYAPAFISGRSSISDEEIVEKGTPLSNKYFLKVDKLDGKQVVNTALWVPGGNIPNPIFRVQREGATTTVRVMDGIVENSDNVVLKSRMIQATGWVDTDNYRVNGSVVLDKDKNLFAGTTIAASSDERLKSNMREIDNVSGIIDALRPVTYEFNTALGKQRFGFSAQEVKKVLPDIVTEDSNGYLGVSYQDIIPILVQQVKDLTNELRELKSSINLQDK